MCIMFITDKKKGLPSSETLAHIFTSNPDGGGLAYVYTDTTGKRYLAMEKGIMTKEEWVRKVTEHFQKLNSDTDYFIAHTRISTSGGKAPSKTHPFKTSKGGYLFQNGISPTVERKLRASESDSEWLAKHFVDINWVKSYDSTSRFVVINPDGTMETSGSWVADDAGRKWSNSGFTPYRSPYTSYHWRGYNDNDCSVYGYNNTHYPQAKYTSNIPSVSAMVLAFNLVADNRKLGTEIYNCLKDHVTYIVKGELYMDDKVIENFVYRDGVIEPVFKNSTANPISNSDIVELEDQINGMLKREKVNLFFDKDLGDSVRVSVIITDMKYTKTDGALAKITMSYMYEFDEVGNPLLESSVMESSFSIPEDEWDYLRLAKEVLYSEIIETTIDDEYFYALGDETEFDTSHRMTIGD